MSFEERIPKLLFHKDGSPVKTHFEIGKHLHIDTYYYAKGFFQEVQNCEEISIELSDKIIPLFTNEGSITILGVAPYSGMLLHKTTSRLKSIVTDKNRMFNYGIIDNSQKRLSFFYEPETVFENVIVVIPITCTFTTALRVFTMLESEEYKYKYGSKIKQLRCISIFLIKDERLHNQSNPGSIVIDSLTEPTVKELYKSFLWTNSYHDKVTINDGKSKIYDLHYLHELVSKFHLPEKCISCFPQIKTDEKSLFPTLVNPDTPSLIFRMPKFADRTGKIHTWVFNNVKIYNAHRFGHLSMNNNSYLHYIRRDVFYDDNKKEILDHFSENLEVILKDCDEHDRILLITPKHNTSSKCLEDLIDIPPLKDKLVSIIAVNPADEYLENFMEEFNRHNDYKKIIFFDYLISAGKIFKLISDYLKHAKNESDGFDMMLVVIDRTTEYAKQEILRKLWVKSDEDCSFRFVAFFKLDIPLTDAINSGNPINSKNVELRKLLQQSHLDALKLSIINEIEEGAPKSLAGLEQLYQESDDAKKNRWFFKLHISHEISGWLYTYSAGEFDISKLERLIESFTSEGAKVFKKYLKHQQEGDLQKREITNTIIKTLSRSPFSFYQAIYQAVFEYVVVKLADAVKKWRTGISNEDKDNLKFYIRISVELNSNYILSEEFMAALRMNFDRSDDEDMTDLKYFILRHYKELVSRTPARAIKLEEILNQKQFLPEPFINTELPIQDTLHNKYYQLNRIIKAENIFLLDELKCAFVESTDQIGNMPEDIKDLKLHIRRNFLSSPYDSDARIRLALQFLSKSKIVQDLSDKQAGGQVPGSVQDAVENMLAARYLMERRKTNKGDFSAGIKQILAYTASILGEGLNYALVVQRDRGAHSIQTETDNIYTILSSDDEKSEQPVLSKDGLIIEMLNGLKDRCDDHGKIQTFIPIIQTNGGGFASFCDTYFTVNDAIGEPCSVDYIRKDFASASGGIEMLEKSKMILLFRFATISEKEANGAGFGKAVLAICYPTSKFNNTIEDGKIFSETKQFTDFINIERLRLLLLIKEDLCQYIAGLFNNEAFIELLVRRKELALKKAMEHGIMNYFKATDFIFAKKSINGDDILLLEFLQKKILRHVQSITDANFGITEIAFKKTYTEGQLRDLFDILMMVPYLARKKIKPVERKFRIETGAIDCHPIIFEQVIPELILNMRKHSLEYRGNLKLSFRVTKENNILYFENTYNPDIIIPSEPKPYGGLTMCSLILNKLNLKILTPELAKEPSSYKIGFSLTPILK